MTGLRPCGRIAGQFAVLSAVAIVAAALSDGPTYRQIPPGTAVVKLSFVHGGDRSARCRRRSQEELAKLPPNMRRPMDCPRARPPVVSELAMDGRIIFAASLPPGGLSGDGQSQVYRRFEVPAGEHRILVRLRDTPRAEGFDHERAETVTLEPGQSFSIDFRPEAGGFIFR